MFVPHMSVISSLFTRIVWFAGKKLYLQILMLTNGNIIIHHTITTVNSIKCTRKNILDIRKQIQYVILLSDTVVGFLYKGT